MERDRGGYEKLRCEVQEMKTAIYGRVSTTKQEVENQIKQMKEYCKVQGHEIYKVYIDEGISGKEPIKPALEEMLRVAISGKFHFLLFWSLDRLSREGALKTLLLLKRFDDMGLSWKSYTEQYLDSSGIFKDAIISILSTLAKQERIQISDRTKSAYQRKKSRGESWGRKKLPLDPSTILAKRGDGLSLRRIAELENCSYNTIRNVLKKYYPKGLKMRASKRPKSRFQNRGFPVNQSDN